MSCFVADLNHANPIDFDKLRLARWSGLACEAIIHKATQGSRFSDQMYGIRRSQAARLGFLWGAYAFNTGEPVADQVAQFLKVAQPGTTTALFLDFEDNSQSEMSLAQAIEFLDRVDNIVGRRCGIYSGNRLKQLIVAATSAQRDFLSSHALWGCEYGPAFKMNDVRGRLLPWPAPFLWQFTGDGVGPPPHSLDGLEQGADLSIFRGTRDELERLWPGSRISAPVVAQAPPPPALPAKPVAIAANDGWLSNFIKKLRG